MGWFRLHPIAVAAVCAVVLILVGIVIAGGSFARTPSNASISWESPNTGQLFSGSILQGREAHSNLTADDIYNPLAELQHTDTGTVLIPSEAERGIVLPTKNATVSEPLIYDASSLEKLFATVQATAQVPVTTTVAEDFGLDDLFAYLPFKRTFPEQVENATPTQAALYAYGNEAGTALETYSDRHRDQAAVLRRFIEDLGSETKKQEVLYIAEDLVTVGDDLADMQVVPSVVRSAHDRVAAGYRNIGSLLADVATAQNDAQLLETITAYNTAADSLNQSMIALATVFSVSEVSFNEGDPGRVFVFTPQ